jgi:hypothetical protein
MPAISYTPPSYHWVKKLIVRPKFPTRVIGIENALVVIGVDAEGNETVFLTLHGAFDETPIEIDASNDYPPLAEEPPTDPPDWEAMAAHFWDNEP